MNHPEKAEALNALADHPDELHLYQPASLIGKAMYRAAQLGLGWRPAHAVVRRHFRRFKIHHWVWWTKDRARGSWQFAKEFEKKETL